MNKIDNTFKEKVLDWLAVLIPWVFGAAIILPSLFVPNFFMMVVAPVMIVLGMFVIMVWAIARIHRRRLMADKEEAGQCAKQ